MASTSTSAMASASTLDDSPRKAPSARPSREGERTNLTQHRKTLIGDSEIHLVLCEADSWVAQYTKHNGVEIVAHIKDALIKNNVYNHNVGWVPLHRAKEKKLSENDTFAILGVIATHIAIVARDYNPNLEFVSAAVPSPHDKALLEVLEFTFFSDWRTVVRPAHELPQPAKRRSARLRKDDDPNPFKDWEKFSNAAADMAMIGEFKLHNNYETRSDNEHKIVSAASHLLYNDPRRTSVTGITIEDRVLRLWNFNRSYIAMSVDIDINQDPDVLISFLLFSMTAPQALLGFDESIRRVVKKEAGVETVCFEMRVQDRWFQTVGPPISEEAAYTIVGRATRVWRVREKLGDKLRKDEWALKDCWIFHDAATEREIQNKIFGALNEEDRKDAKQYFLTYEVDEVIKHLDRLKLVRVVGSEGTKFTRTTREHVGSGIPGSSSRQATRDSAVDLPEPLASINLDHTERKNVRSIMLELCQSVYELMDFKSLLLCLFGVTMALFYMFKAKCVHRDVSAGNSLFYEGTGKISDVEYSKEYGQLSASDSKTGTPDFMAVEYQDRMYLFRPNTTDMQSATDWLDDSDPGALGFVPNYVHDLESIMWQYLWFIHHRIPRVSLEQKSPAELFPVLSAISQSATRFFSHGIDGHTDRRRLLTSPDNQEIRAPLVRMFQPLLDVYLLEPITLVLALRKEYTRIEGTSPIVVERRRQYSQDIFAADIYEPFKVAFKTALNSMGDDQNTPVIDLRSAKNSVTKSSQERRDMPAPPAPPSASGSRRSQRTPSPTPAGSSRRSNKKRSRADAQDDVEVEGEGRKQKQKQNPKERKDEQTSSTRLLRSSGAVKPDSPASSSLTRKTRSRGEESGSGNKTR